MIDAFRQALTEFETRPSASPLDLRTRQVIQATATGDAGVQLLSPAELARLTYRARKLGRAWASYTHQVPPPTRPLERLRTEWTVLASQLAGLAVPQRVAVLDEFRAALGLDDRTHAGAKRAYLHHQAAVHPEAFVGLTARAGLSWLSPVSYLVHAIEELADCPLLERQQLHARLAAQTRAHAEPSPRELLAFLGCWLAARSRGETTDSGVEEAA